MHNLSEEDLKKSERHNKLTEKLKAAQAEHLQKYEDFYLGKVTAEDLIAAQENLNEIQEEWRNTILTLKKIK